MTGQAGRSAQEDKLLTQHYALRKRLGNQVISELISAYRAGATTSELAERYGVAKSALLQLLHREGLAQRRRLTDEEIALARCLRQKGWAYATIGHSFSVYGSTVWRALQDSVS